MADNLPDPVNPENDPIEDGMRRDGEFFRDVAEGKTASEIAFDLELGTAERRAEEHDSLMEEIGQVIKADTPPTDTSASFEAIEELDIPIPQIAPDPVATPTSEVQAIHNNLMDDMAAVAAPEVKRQQIRERIQARAAEARPPTLQQTQRLMGEHGKLFVDVGRIQDEAEPAIVGGAMPPDVAARIAHPGREKEEELGGVMAAYAEADKRRWESLFRLLEMQIDFIAELMTRMDELRGQLERSRL